MKPWSADSLIYDHLRYISDEINLRSSERAPENRRITDFWLQLKVCAGQQGSAMGRAGQGGHRAGQENSQR